MAGARELRDDAQAFEEQARRILQRASERGLMIATAESCTGGLLASLFTDIEGHSGCFERGFVTYSEAAKCELLGVEPIVLRRHGAVSETVAMAMAEGALAHSHAGLVAAITGFAGASGEDDEAGLVHIAVLRRDRPPHTRKCHFGERDRAEVRHLALAATLDMFEDVLAEE